MICTLVQRYFVLKLVIENKLNLDNIITEYLQNNELHKDLIKDKRCMNVKRTKNLNEV